MDTSFFKKKGIAFERVAHAEIKEAGVAGAAQVLNCPKAYIITTVLFDADGKTVAAVAGGETAPDAELLKATLGAKSVTKIEPKRAEEITGLPKLKISPLTIWKNSKIEKIIWDECLLDFSYVIFAETGAEESVKVDTREFARAGLKSAPIAKKSAPATAYDVLLERGFIDRITDEDLARKVFSDKSVRGYIGFDPTADSLHVGSLVPIMALAHIQRGGLRPIAIVGGGTALVGDPSGKTEMRKMLTRDDIARNMKGISAQLSNYIAFGEAKATMLNNADWLVDVSYVDFLREVGVHFSVNRMIKAECFAARMEKGLSFIEFNYMLMQAYDFVYLAEKYNCLVQLGGSDQWGNIIAGKDLGHRATGTTLFGEEVKRGDRTVGVTFPLLKNSSGTKFGKTEGGNVWLDSARSTVYEFFQFWRNTDDADVRRVMSLFTLIPMEDVRRLTAGKSGEELNLAKEITAFATTALLHGPRPALAAAATAKSRFGGYGDSFSDNILALGLADKKNVEDFKAGNLEAAPAEGGAGASTGLPTIEIKSAELTAGVTVMSCLVELGFVSSNGEARRMIKQNGVKLEGETVKEVDAKLPPAAAGTEFNIRMGKKKHGVVRIQD